MASRSPGVILISIPVIAVVRFVRITIIAFIKTAQSGNLQGICSKLSPFGCIYRAGKGLDHDCDPLGLAWRQNAARKRRGDGVRRRGNVARTLDRRQGEPDGALSADRQNAFDAEPQRDRIAGKRQLDGLAVNASASPSSSTAAASVALLREPRRRPAGLPDRPFSNGCPRARAAAG
jgi:hypothetical protein